MPENGHEVPVHSSGKMRTFRIRVLPGDKTAAQYAPCGLPRRRITWRPASPLLRGM